MGLRERTKAAIQLAVDKREPFKRGNVKGKWFESWYDAPKGRLDVSQRMPAAGVPTFVIYSYKTPIAWYIDFDQVDGPTHEYEPTIDRLRSEWVVPDVHYSMTTTQHQNVVRVAVDNAGLYTDRSLS